MILITGSSGHLSSLVITKALALALAPIAAGRSIAETDAVQRHMDFDHPASIDLTGVKTMLLVSAGYAEDDVVIQRHENAIAAAERQGVRHIVYTSLTGTGDHLAFALAHRWTERRLQRSSVNWTILRNGLYAELIGALATPVEGTISAPFGTASLSPVSREDLADATVAVLAAPERHLNATYELAGTRAWSIADLASVLGVTYSPSPLEQKRAELNAASLLPFQPAMLMSIYSAAAAGFLKASHSDLPSLLGAAPREGMRLAATAAGDQSDRLNV